MTARPSRSLTRYLAPRVEQDLPYGLGRPRRPGRLDRPAAVRRRGAGRVAPPAVHRRPARRGRRAPPRDWVAMPEDPARGRPLTPPRPRPAAPARRGKYASPLGAAPRPGSPRSRRSPSATASRSASAALITNGEPPASFQLEHFLGALRSTGVAGDQETDPHRWDLPGPCRERSGDRPLREALELGYVEEAPLPGFDTLALAVHRATGQHILVSLPDDPILHAVDVIEPPRLHRPLPAAARETPAAPGRSACSACQGDRLRAEAPSLRDRTRPQGSCLAEVGALAESGLQGSVAAWILDGVPLYRGYRIHRYRYAGVPRQLDGPPSRSAGEASRLDLPAP